MEIRVYSTTVFSQSEPLKSWFHNSSPNHSRAQQILSTAMIFCRFWMLCMHSCSWYCTERQRLEVVIGGKVLQEVALLLHDAVELVKVDLAITITVSLVDHILELLVVDVLSEL